MAEQKQRNYFQPLCFETLVTWVQLFQREGEKSNVGALWVVLPNYRAKLSSECHIISFQKVPFLGKHRMRTYKKKPKKTRILFHKAEIVCQSLACLQSFPIVFQFLRVVALMLFVLI